jgi:hypothetical protein
MGHAIKKARRLAVAEHRRATFNTAFEQWQTAGNMRAFCDALEHASAAGQAAGNGELAAWLIWARARADEIDPTVGTPTLTRIDFTIEPSPEDLRAHLNGWSPSRRAKGNRTRRPAVSRHGRIARPAEDGGQRSGG